MNHIDTWLGLYIAHFRLHELRIEHDEKPFVALMEELLVDWPVHGFRSYKGIEN